MAAPDCPTTLTGQGQARRGRTSRRSPPAAVGRHLPCRTPRARPRRSTYVPAATRRCRPSIPDSPRASTRNAPSPTWAPAPLRPGTHGTKSIHPRGIAVLAVRKGAAPTRWHDLARLSGTCSRWTSSAYCTGPRLSERLRAAQLLPLPRDHLQRRMVVVWYRSAWAEAG